MQQRRWMKLNAIGKRYKKLGSILHNLPPSWYTHARRVVVGMMSERPQQRLPHWRDEQ
jgi:hypothetical protein